MADKIKHLEDRATQSDAEMEMLWQRLEDCHCATPAEISPEKCKNFKTIKISLRFRVDRVVNIKFRSLWLVLRISNHIITLTIIRLNGMPRDFCFVFLHQIILQKIVYICQNMSLDHFKL